MVAVDPRSCLHRFEVEVDSTAALLLEDPVAGVGHRRSDRDQLWAEAVVMFSRGDSWHLVAEDDIAAASEEAGDFSTQDPWISEICDYWNSQHLANRRPFETTALLTYLGIDKRSQKQGDVMRVTRLMRGAGFTSKRKRDRDIRRTYWQGPTGHAGQAN